MGSHPGILSGMPNVSEPLFCAPITSPWMSGVVGTPLVALKIPPTSHPRSTAAAGPCIERGTGICQSALMVAVWVKLKSEGARLICGANQNQVVTELEKESPNGVAEVSSIALL